jgi:hypothetical protein
MSDKIDLKDFNENDIVCFKEQLFKVCQLREAVKEAFNYRDVGYCLCYTLKDHQEVPINVSNFGSNYQDECGEWWFSDGGDCEILRPGNQGWQKGKIRIKVRVDLEFCPNEAETQLIESPLDDIRQAMTEEN